jgi:hypothetical protein
MDTVCLLYLTRRGAAGGSRFGSSLCNAGVGSSKGLADVGRRTMLAAIGFHLMTIVSSLAGERTS